MENPFTNKKYAAIFAELLKEEENGDICAICHSVNDYHTVTLSCNHKYHEKCILKNIKNPSNKFCPYCKREISNIPKQCSHNSCSTNVYNDKQLCGKHIKQLIQKERKAKKEAEKKARILAKKAALAKKREAKELEKQKLKEKMRCHGIYKTGKRKGDRCTNKGIVGGFCKIHSKTASNII